MTDEELQDFLDWSRNPHSFDQLLDEWKAWAKSVIESAKVDGRGKGHVQRDEAVLYLCQIIQVFEGLCKGITEDDLRSKFISGLVVSGFPPQSDASFHFQRAMQDAQSRGCVTCKDVDLWHPGMASGSGWNTICQLTLAGRKLAESARNVEASQVPHQEQNGEQPEPNDTVERNKDQHDFISLWRDANDVLKIAEELSKEIGVFEESEYDVEIERCDGNFSEEAGISRITALAQSLETLHTETRFVDIQESVFSSTENDSVYDSVYVDVNTAVYIVFSHAKLLVTRIGLGRFDTGDYPVRKDSKDFYHLVENLKDKIRRLEIVPEVGNYLDRVARENLNQQADDRRNADRPLPPETAYLIVKYLDHAERPILCTTDLFEQDMAILAQLVEEELELTDRCSYSLRAATESRLSQKELVAIRVSWKELEKLATCGPDYDRVVDFPSAGWGRYLDAHFIAKRYLNEVHRSADERAFMASCTSGTSQSTDSANDRNEEAKNTAMESQPAENTKPVKAVPVEHSGTVQEEAHFWFKQEGAYYRVRYDGESGTIPAHLRGAKYILEMLQHPNTFCKATVLRGAVESTDSGKTDQAESQEALAACKKELKQINVDIQDAKCDGIELEEAELVEKRDKVIDEIKRLTGLGGKPRRRSRNESARVSVKNSIELVIRKCRDNFELPRFAAHLDEAIETGAQCAYRPASPALNWKY